MGVQVSAANRSEGKGACFTPAHGAIAILESGRVKAAKILVTDDEMAIRRLLKAGLSRAGFAVVEAANAREALNALAIDKPDLVLLGLGLPDRDGLELIGAIKAAKAALLVVSARDATGERWPRSILAPMIM
jgi:PleD family two-component response regulator